MEVLSSMCFFDYTVFLAVINILSVLPTLQQYYKCLDSSSCVFCFFSFLYVEAPGGSIRFLHHIYCRMCRFRLFFNIRVCVRSPL